MRLITLLAQKNRDDDDADDDVEFSFEKQSLSFAETLTPVTRGEYNF